LYFILLPITTSCKKTGDCHSVQRRCPVLSAALYKFHIVTVTVIINITCIIDEFSFSFRSTPGL